MATIKQNKIVSNLTENYRTKGELLKASDYSESSSKQPSRILGGKGLQQLADKAEVMGINDELTLAKVKKAIESNNLQLAISTIFNWWRVIYPNEKPDTQVNIDNRSITFTGSEDQNKEIDEFVISRYKELEKEGKI